MLHTMNQSVKSERRRKTMNNPNAYQDISAALTLAWLYNDLDQNSMKALSGQISRYMRIDRYANDLNVKMPQPKTVGENLQ